MSKPYIEVTIDLATAETKVEAHGFKGKACVEGTAEILAALGKSAKRTLKSDYHQREAVSVPRMKAGR